MERQIIEVCIKRRQPLPDTVANAPLIKSGLEPYYIAFWELSSCRAIGMGVGPIPWTAIDRYAQRHGVRDEDGFEDLVDLVRAMDDVFLTYQRDQADKPTGDKSGPINPRRTVRI